jgi:hypothetical protein
VIPRHDPEKLQGFGKITPKTKAWSNIDQSEAASPWCKDRIFP